MKLYDFKIWLEGFGDGVGLTKDQIQAIYDKVMLIKGIEDHVRKESMKNLDVSLFPSSNPVQSMSNQCLHSPDAVCLNCTTNDATYSNSSVTNIPHSMSMWPSSGRREDNPLSMHYKYTLPEDR